MDKNYSPILRPKRQRYNRENGKKNRNYGTRDIINVNKLHTVQIQVYDVRRQYRLGF